MERLGNTNADEGGGVLEQDIKTLNQQAREKLVQDVETKRIEVERIDPESQERLVAEEELAVMESMLEE